MNNYLYNILLWTFIPKCFGCFLYFLLFYRFIYYVAQKRPTYFICKSLQDVVCLQQVKLAAIF